MLRNGIIVLALLAALAGCGTRSISNSGYQENGYSGGNPLYQGEIGDLDLFVPQGSSQNLEGGIAKALADNHPVVARRGKPLLVVQSGAWAPDDMMIDLLKGRFQVAPFSGIPERSSYPAISTASAPAPGSYGERLRLAAAQGGYEQILVYWGQLDALRSGGVTKAVSWVPIVGAVIPDESQDMRIRLKAAIIDVASGRWRMIQPDAIENSAISAWINRASSDQDQVQRLKAAGYAKLADMIIGEASAATSN
ncbi:MAG: hypothetical protein R3D05_01685 [Dongiaceae bacterium]